MSALRRMYVSFVLLFNLFSFGAIFLILSNSSPGEGVVFIGEGDGEFAFVLAVVGIVANIGLGYALWRESATPRRLDAERGGEKRSRITGE